MRKAKRILTLILVSMFLVSMFTVVLADQEKNAAEPTAATMKILSLDKAIADKDNWDFEEGSLAFASKSVTHTKLGETIFGYKGAKYKDELLQFKAKFEFDDGATWQGFAIRSLTTRSAAWSGNPGYLVVVKKDSIELQCFQGSQRFLKIIPNNGIIEQGKEYTISIGAININDGVNILMYVNKEVIFNCYDTSDNAILEEGYINFYGGSKMTITALDKDDTTLTPAVAAAQIEGEIATGSTLKTSYQTISFNDAKPEGMTTQWYISDTYSGELTEFDQKQVQQFNTYKPIGTYKPIEGANTDTYVLKEEDNNKFIQFRVLDKDGNIIGMSNSVTVDAYTDLIKDSIIMYIDWEYAYANGTSVMIDPDDQNVVPTVIDNRTLVPVRFISEKFEADVTYDDKTEEINITLGDKVVKMVIGSDVISVNGTESKLEVPAQTIYDRTMIPLRALTDALGKNIFWDEQGVIIISDKVIKLDSEKDKDFITKIIDSFANMAAEL